MTKSIKFVIALLALFLLAAPCYAQSGGIKELNLSPELYLKVNDGLTVRNATGGSLAAAQLVYICGYLETDTSGGYVRQPKVCAADADVAGARAMFILERAIANNASGYALKRIRLMTVNTNGSTVGNPVYLSQTAGSWTLTAPVSAAKQVVGRVAVVSSTVGQIEINLEAESPVSSGADIGQPTMIYWNGSDSLQGIITAITDATAAKPYTIVVPPGTYSISSGIAMKAFVNLRGQGGRGRVTIFSGGTFGVAAGTGLPTGVSRIRVDGIRFESVTLSFINADAAKTLLVVMDDCPLNGGSKLIVTGYDYDGTVTHMTHLEFSNANIDNNTQNLFTNANMTFINSTLLGMYFVDSNGFFYGGQLSSACNFSSAGSTKGNWFEFAGIKIDTMVLNDPTSESVLAATNAFVANANVQIHNVFHGVTAPASITSFTYLQPGALYFCNSDSKLYAKTGIVGANTWTTGW